MALKKAVKVPSGYSPEYWSISEIRIDKDRNVFVLLDAYIDEDAKKVNKNSPVANGQYLFKAAEAEKVLDFSELQKQGVTIYSRIYELLKLSEPKFSGADDV